jgi:hypothetical protein
MATNVFCEVTPCGAVEVAVKECRWVSVCMLGVSTQERVHLM